MTAASSRPARSWVGVAAVLVLAMVGCGAEPLTVPDRGAPSPVALPAAGDHDDPPAGQVAIAHPEEPASFLPSDPADVAAGDLMALWGLPLLRLDEAGQVRRGLVRDWTVVGPVEDGWRVDLDLAAGSWSDGAPVVATDVVATLEARRDADPDRFGMIRRVEALDDHGVAVVLDRPLASWDSLLVEVGTVLPAGAWPDAATTYADAVPVSGGWFRVTAYDPGLRVVLEAHDDGPLGPPGLERIEVLFTPSYETALGLLEDGEVDGLMGYLPVNGVPRATEVEGVQAAAPLGGTLVSLAFRPAGGLGGPDDAARRRGVVETVDVAALVEGLLGPAGEVATTPWPGVDHPAPPPVGEVREGQQFTIAYPGGAEVLGFAARAIQRDLVSRGMTVDLTGEPAPRFVELDRGGRDVAVVVTRSPRRPSLAPWVDDVAVARAAGAAPLHSPAVRDGLTAVARSAQVAPLFRVGVLHAWAGIAGVRPSAWPGAGFWNAGEWTTTDG